jgi:biotin carboxyl carrier protein
MDAQAIGLDAYRPSTVEGPLPPSNTSRPGVRSGTTSPPRIELSALRIIDRLVEFGAQGVTQWIILPDGRVAGRVFRAQATDELRRQEQLVAGDVLRNQKIETRILSLSPPSMIVGSPCWGLPEIALTVNFPIMATDNREEFIHQRQAVVEMAVTQLGLLWLKDSSATNQAASPSTASNSPIPTPVASSLNSWAEIRRAFTKLLTESFRKHRANWKSYFVVLAGLMAVLLLPWPHVVKCQVQCEPLERRFVVAPFEATLLKTHVEVGQLVEAGQVLAELDGSNLRSQIASLQAKLSQANQRRDAALANRDASKSEFERLETNHLQEEIELLQNRERCLQIRAPISGVVVSGDLRKAVGATLTVGQSLFEIGPLDELIAEIAIPEDEIAYVKSELNARVSLDAVPGHWHTSKIERIHPRNEIREFNSVFIAEALIANQEKTVRPGMNGVARIQAGWQPLGWIVFRKPWNALRQTIGW